MSFQVYDNGVPAESEVCDDVEFFEALAEYERQHPELYEGFEVSEDEDEEEAENEDEAEEQKVAEISANNTEKTKSKGRTIEIDRENYSTRNRRDQAKLTEILREMGENT